MSVYGDFLENFAELFITLNFVDGTKKIRGILISHGGDLLRLSYEKYESDGLMKDTTNNLQLYTTSRYAAMLREGDELIDPDSGCVIRVVGRTSHKHIAGYAYFHCERVTGSTSLHTEQLHIKEGTFA